MNAARARANRLRFSEPAVPGGKFRRGRWKFGAAAASVADRFWSKVDKNGPVSGVHPDLGPCWPWTAERPAAITFDFAPGTLAVALAAEAQGRGHVAFQCGVPVWLPGPPRFPEVRA